MSHEVIPYEDVSGELAPTTPAAPTDTPTEPTS